MGLFQTSFYCVELIANSNNQGFAQRFNNFTVFPDFIVLFTENDKEFNSLKQILFSSDIKKNMPDYVYN